MESTQDVEPNFFRDGKNLSITRVIYSFLRAELKAIKDEAEFLSTDDKKKPRNKRLEV